MRAAIEGDDEPAGRRAVHIALDPTLTVGSDPVEIGGAAEERDGPRTELASGTMGEHAIPRIARLRPFGIDRQRVKGEWLACVDHGQRTEDFMDSLQQIGVSFAVQFSPSVSTEAYAKAAENELPPLYANALARFRELKAIPQQIRDLRKKLHIDNLQPSILEEYFAAPPELATALCMRVSPHLEIA